MGMSQPSATTLIRFEELAYWVRETFDERGYRIGVALDLDASFQAGEDPRSTLARALMKEAAASAARRVGMDVVPGSGGARDIQSFDGNIDRRFRVRRAKPLYDGTFLIETSSRSILETDGDSMFREERWVFAYTLTSNNDVDVIFIAEVLDVVDGTPGHMVLGDVYRLGGAPTPPAGFVPSDEDLDLDEESDEGDAQVG